MGNDVVTSAQLVLALKANSGVSNSVAEMIGINRNKIEQLVTANSEIVERLNKCGEYLEVKYNKNKATVFQYSNFGRGVVYKLDNNSDNIIV